MRRGNRKINLGVVVAAKYQSFILEGELVSKYNLVFFKMEGGKWYKISIGEGESEIKMMTKPPKQWVGPEQGGVEYPHFDLDREMWEMGMKIVEIKEYLFKGQPDQSCGLVIYFEDAPPLSIHEVSEFDLELTRGVSPELMEVCTLAPFLTVYESN